MILLGNKIDNELNREVQYQEAIDLASKYNITYLEVSAAKDKNITEAFSEVTRKALSYQKQDERPPISDERKLVLKRQTEAKPKKKCCK